MMLWIWTHTFELFFIICLTVDIDSLSSIVDDSGKQFTHEYPLHLHHFYWVQPDTLVASSTDPGGAGTTLYHMTIKDEEKQLAIRYELLACLSQIGVMEE